MHAPYCLIIVERIDRIIPILQLRKLRSRKARNPIIGHYWKKERVLESPLIISRNSF